MSEEMAEKGPLTSEKKIPNLLTVKQFCSQHSWPSESAMRSYIYRAEELGLSPAINRFRRRVLINVELFFEIIRGNNKYD